MDEMKKTYGSEHVLSTDYYGDILQELRGIFFSPYRNYKDRVFRMLFMEKIRALELYNAMNGTHYTNVDDLIITTLENAIYLGMKNDVSFVLYDQLMLYEHQASKNPNMPLRDLLYVACVYSRLTANKNIYGSRLIKLPEPKFVVFYNGTEPMPERQELLLSDAYETEANDPALELKVLVLNINPGYNEELKKHCPTLYEYMLFVDTVRRSSEIMPFPEAMDTAINECMKNGILEDFLRKNKSEVNKVILFEYDEEKYHQMIREEAAEEAAELAAAQGEARGELRGKSEGENRLSSLISKLLDLGKTEAVKQAVSDKAAREALYKEYGL